VNNRRSLLIVLGATALAPRAVFAQSNDPILIGWLHGDSRESSARYLGAFKEGLAALGWKEGSQIVIEEHWADGRYARLQSLAEELAGEKPVIIVAGPLQAVAAVAKAAPKTPTVMASGADPVAAGLVKSHARPGGMITAPRQGLVQLQRGFSGELPPRGLFR
jgi:putative ABC transport system substrate-binding protein